MNLRIQLFLGFSLVFVLMIVIAAFTYAGITALIETAEMVSHTHQVIIKARRIEKLLVDMETGPLAMLSISPSSSAAAINCSVPTFFMKGNVESIRFARMLRSMARSGNSIM